ncbi:MAG: glycerate kinase [Candidatus Saccharimonadaceae bacterium]
MRKIIIAPDSFKGSLTSTEVATAIEVGILRVFPNCEIVKIPVADGGEGTTDTLINALGGNKLKINVHDSLMRPIKAEYGILNDGLTAIIEMAAANGITLLNKEEQNPLKTTTFGTGEIIKHALKKGCRTFLIGIGGSATNDAGTGMLQALGFRFLDEYGNETNGTGETLHTIRSIDEFGVLPELNEAHFIIACDVNNPFNGPNGAAYIFAPQKGANNQMTIQLDKGMESFRQLILSKKELDLNTIPGAGAAGGLGGGFIAFLQSQLKPGIDMVLEAVNFEQYLSKTELVITGEGKLDRQTAMGKSASGILTAASRANVPVIAIGGYVENAEELNNQGFLSVYSISSAPSSLEKAMEKDNAQNNTTQITEQVMRTIKHYKNTN